jgi:nucleoside-diphosphate-sugar epimerase
MSNQRLLLTGATGIVGREVVRELLRSPDPPEMLALLRGSDAEIEAKRRCLCEWAEVPPERAERLAAIRGDMTCAELGLTEKDRRRARSVTGILHAGAATRFDQTAEAAHLSNVVGTTNILAHARHCLGIERIAIVSTAFVAGRRGGTIYEDDLSLREGFNNEYERSKAQAEYQARIAMRELPVDVYRLSIVVGRRSDGCISRFSGIYPIFRLFHNGLLAMIPGVPGQTIDLIPSDFAAAAICHFLSAKFASGVTYHICAGGDRSIGLDELFPAVSSCLAETDAAWRGRGQSPPLIVAAEVFKQFVSVVELTGNRRLRHIIKQTRSITRQLEIAKIFDTHGLDQARIGNVALALPHARGWLPQIIAHGVATRWRSTLRIGVK